MGKHARTRSNPALRLGIGFSLALGLLTVSAVSPSIDQLSSANNSTPDSPAQVLAVENFDFELDRGNYGILTGADATGVLVATAPVPEADSVKGYALSKVREYGWEYNQFSCLVKALGARK